jgi:Protein of unknown function (DUF3352)
MRFRPLLATLLCLVPLVAAGCGSSSSGDNGKSPLDNALGYMPKSAPLVVAIDTDLSDGQWKSLQANVKKFPFAGQVTTQLKDAINSTGVNYDTDVKPLLGNEAVLGSPTVQSTVASSTRFVAAIEVKDKGKLQSLLGKEKDIAKDGKEGDAQLYKSKTDNSEVALDGDVFLVSDSKQQTVAAIQQRQRDDRFTEDEFNGALSGLPSDALGRVYVNAQALINGTPESAKARQVKWVAALRTAGFALSSPSDGISFDYNVKTDSSQLSDADLPIASGDQSPPVPTKGGEVEVGVRGLNQTIHFIESVSRTASPSGYGKFLRNKQKLESQLGLNLDKDLIDQLSGNTAFSTSSQGHYALRVEPKDPAALSQTLAKFAKAAPKLAKGAGLRGAKITRVRGLYKLTGRDGKTYYYGVVGKVFAFSDNLASLGQIASDTPQPVNGAKGAVAINADIGKLASQLIAEAAGGGLGGAFGGSIATAPLGALTGWTSSSTSGLNGHMKLAIK